MKPMISLLVALGVIASGTADLAAQSPALSAQQRSMVAIAGFVANGRLDDLKQALVQGFDSGLTVNQVGEIMVQAYAYTGFPRSLNGLATLRTVLQERQAKGIRDALGQEPDPLPETKSRYALGRDNINTLTGAQANQPRPESLGYEAAIDVFLKEHLFADIISRDNLAFSERELVTVSFLSSLGGVAPQLMSHMNGAMNLGASETQMRELIGIIRAQVGTAEGQAADKILNQVLANRKEAGDAVTARPMATSAPGYVPEVFDRGRRMENEHFVGAFWLASMIPQGSSVTAPVVNVTFEPGTRNNWHSHPGGQILMVTMGRGYYQEWGQPARELKEGDVVVIGSNVKHWHGAAKDSWFAHLVIDPDPKAGPVMWLEKVDDAAYKALK